MYIRKVLALDAEAHALFMTDVGKSALSFECKKSHLDMRAVGSQIGSWLARLSHVHHRRIGENMTQLTIWDEVAPMQSSILAKNLTDKHGIAPELVQQIIPVASGEQASGPKCVVQGDFRPGNIHIRTLGASQSDVAVVNWECIRLGTGTSDVIQFATEAYVLEYIHGKKGLRESFLKLYREDAEVLVNEEFIILAALQFGAFMAKWMYHLDWCETDKQKTEMEELGVEFIKRALDKDLDWLKASPLGGLF